MRNRIRARHAWWLGALAERACFDPDPVPSELRFVMLETIREHALQRLASSGEAAEMADMQLGSGTLPDGIMARPRARGCSCATPALRVQPGGMRSAGGQG
jgi:hypothetical protein